MMSRVVILTLLKVSVWIMISIQQSGQASDTILPSQAILVGQTLLSASQIFELGFFSPADSSRRYIGIWFKTTPEVILWVANRDNPLSASDDSASFTLSDDGNLKILDGSQEAVWSTNIFVHLKHPIVVLNDTGDLILKDNTSGRTSWESFSHPCDVYLPTMQFEINIKLGEKQLWSSWRSENDPAVGHFTAGLLPQFPVQAFVSSGEAIYWRSGPWNGLKFVGIPDTSFDYFDNWSIRQNEETGILHFGVNQYDLHITRFMKLFPEGTLKTMERVGNNWSVTWVAPKTLCDVYGTCGPFGVCNANQSPICTCPRGFIPNSVDKWSKGNWTDGCVRRTKLLCSENLTLANKLGSKTNDGFWKLSRMKIPDNHQYFSLAEDTKGCQQGCLSNCTCTAYAYVDGIGCLLWTGDLIDMQEFLFSAEDLFVRLDRSDLIKSKRVMVIISMVSALFIIIACFLIIFAVHKVRNKQKKGRQGLSKKIFLGGSSDEQQLLKWKIILEDELTTFDFEDIVTATNGFSHSNKVGEGGFGAVFKGKLHDGQEIAVKRLSRCSRQGISEFLNEILLISKLQHRNLVKVLGCSIEGDEKIIVYEYLPNGSLDSFLFDSSEKKMLDWATRFNIIQAIARGILYLHRDSRLKVIHRDLKASNVLLDDDMNPKISDFGLARTFQATQESENTLHVVGTYGYMSPEYALRGVFSEKSDVFSFGILLLEIVSGKKISRFDNNKETLGLLGYAWRLWNEGRGLELIDDQLINSDSDQAIRCIHVGLVCVQDRADDRPTIPTVILMLTSDMLIPQPKQPLFFPESPVCHPFELEQIYSANDVTESLVEGR